MIIDKRARWLSDSVRTITFSAMLVYVCLLVVPSIMNCFQIRSDCSSAIQRRYHFISWPERPQLWNFRESFPCPCYLHPPLSLFSLPRPPPPPRPLKVFPALENLFSPAIWGEGTLYCERFDEYFHVPSLFSRSLSYITALEILPNEFSFTEQASMREENDFDNVRKRFMVSSWTEKFWYSAASSS